MSFDLLPLLIAFIFSLSPLLFGIKKKRYFLAILGFVATIIISTSMHILISLVMALVFTWLVLKEDPERENTKDNE